MSHGRIKKRTDRQPDESWPRLPECARSLLRHRKALVGDRSKVIGIKLDGNLAFRESMLDHSGGIHISHRHRRSQVRLLGRQFVTERMLQPRDPIWGFLVCIGLYQIFWL